MGEICNISTPIHYNYTYSAVGSYLIDLLGAHDNIFRNVPLSIKDLEDCASKLSILTAMRAVFPTFVQQDLSRDPFVSRLTDLPMSNTLVDAKLNITSLVDSEWACSQPNEMIRPPHWLTDKTPGEIVADEYNELRMEFMEILAEERKQLDSISSKNTNGAALPHLSDVMNWSWETGTFWYTLALASPFHLSRSFITISNLCSHVAFMRNSLLLFLFSGTEIYEIFRSASSLIGENMTSKLERVLKVSEIEASYLLIVYLFTTPTSRLHEHPVRLEINTDTAKAYKVLSSFSITQKEQDHDSELTQPLR